MQGRERDHREIVCQGSKPGRSGCPENSASSAERRIRRFGVGVLLEPVEIDVDAWFEALHRFREPFMPDGRDQPDTPVRHVFT